MVGGKGGRRQCTFFTLETAEEDHKEGATEFLTTAAADEDWQQFFWNTEQDTSTFTCREQHRTATKALITSF